MTGTEIIRSATFEGMADGQGYPTEDYLNYYRKLSGHVKTMITGFMYISETGRAMHPGQAGLDEPGKAEAFRPVTRAVHDNGGRIIAQIAHVGRQTTDALAVGVSARKSPYFGVRPRVLTAGEIKKVVREFADAAMLARRAGFDGVQLHCAHGYLIHQFMLASVNDRSDGYGDPYRFLREVVAAVRRQCGNDYPVWVKISGEVDIQPHSKQDFIEVIKVLDELQVDAIEISRGTMDLALNIFRGRVPLGTVLKHNPVYAPKSIWYQLFVLPFVRLKMKGFKPCYNAGYAKLAEQHTKIPVYCVGGFRSRQDILDSGLKHISLCRPLICEPDFLTKLKQNPDYRSKCTNCNICAVMVDTERKLRCYGGKEQ